MRVFECAGVEKPDKSTVVTDTVDIFRDSGGPLHKWEINLFKARFSLNARAKLVFTLGISKITMGRNRVFASPILLLAAADRGAVTGSSNFFDEKRSVLSLAGIIIHFEAVLVTGACFTSPNYASYFEIRQTHRHNFGAVCEGELKCLRTRLSPLVSEQVRRIAGISTLFSK